jgi:hypothetical protein
VYLQLEDQAFTAMVLNGDRLAWQERVPLPQGLCVDGEPKAVEALGDLLGDWLVERGFPGARIQAVLPRAATAWRVIAWPDAAWPEHPELVLRQQEQELDLPWSLQDADVVLAPLTGAQPRSLLVAVQRGLLEGWIAVCSQAGVALDGVEALQVCLCRAVHQQLGDGVQVVLQLQPDQSWLLALADGEPLGEWSLPPAADREAFTLALKGWGQRYAPRAALVVEGDPALATALGCPISGLARVDGVPALWGLAEAEQRR